MVGKEKKPRAEGTRILSASRVPAAAVVANRSLVREGQLNEQALESLLSFSVGIRVERRPVDRRRPSPLGISGIYAIF